ncbi:LOW QUALITY PROTEIN: interferon regulatory factor 7 [Pholidichthys leucotaenia]
MKGLRSSRPAGAKTFSAFERNAKLKRSFRKPIPPKPQFAGWLIEQVEGQYTGLCYVGQHKFRVPWKHNSRRDCNDEDSKIFRAWAVASGKINEFPNDRARWKNQLRCALNNLSNRFKMIEDNSKNSDDPHKIYKIINTEQNNEVVHMQYSQEDTDMVPDIYSSPVEDFPLRRCGPAPVLGSSEQPHIEDLEISINYRKKEMIKKTLRISRLKLHYLHPAPEFDGAQLGFPTNELLDHKQIDFTNRILNNIQRGVVLQVQDKGIYACRQDKCRVFASTSDPSVAHPEPTKLPQNTMVELLNFEKYVTELKHFKENSGPSPEYTINMCFGEEYPDGKLLEKKLIVVKVVPLICRHFHEMAQAEGASSLHSANISLQISHNSLYDLINSAFSLPMFEEPLQAAVPFLDHI